MVEDMYDTVKTFLSKRDGKIIGKKHEDFNQMIQFLQRHPSYNNWTNQNPTHFKIGRNRQKSLVLYVKFENVKKYRIVSWVACARQKIPNHKKTEKYKLSQAMRYAIKFQINKFRKSCKFPLCQLCQSRERIEVDHYPNKFSMIRDDFLKMKTKKDATPTSFKYHPKKGIYMFLKGNKSNNYYDDKWKKSWQRYHNKNATYRFLCSGCNKIN